MRIRKRSLVMLGRGGHLRGAYCEGTHQLMVGIDKFGSLYQAARNIGMAYSKAWKMMQEVQQKNGDLIIAHGARGSEITPKGRGYMETYERERMNE